MEIAAAALIFFYKIRYNVQGKGGYKRNGLQKEHHRTGA